MEKEDIDIDEIRELAKRFTGQEIEGCIDQELREGANVCLEDSPPGRVVDQLSKAEFIRNQLDKGVPLREALRELARRIRLVQKGFLGIR